MGKTYSKPLAARHGRGTAWARHAMCESAFNLLEPSGSVQACNGIALPFTVGPVKTLLYTNPKPDVINFLRTIRSAVPPIKDIDHTETIYMQ